MRIKISSTKEKLNNFAYSCRKYIDLGNKFIIFRIPLKILELIIKLITYCLIKIENLIDIVKDKTAYDKVIINFFLTFITPILILNMPISGNMSEFTTNWTDSITKQLQQGLLFSTTMSIAATYISTYISRVNELANKEKDEKRIDESLPPKPDTRKNFNFIANYSNTLFWALSILLLSAILLGVSRSSNSSLNIIFILLQAILYFGILITYGYSEKINRERDEITSDSIKDKTLKDQERAQEESGRMEFPANFMSKYIEQK